MKAMALFLLLLLTTPLWSQQLSEAKQEWPIYFTESAWADLEAQIQAELELTARDAAKAAVAPYLVIEADLRSALAKSTREVRIYKIGMWSAVGVASGALVFYLISLLVP